MDNNFEDSNYRQFDSLNRSIDTETSFLKKKLIETHNKLLRELELNRDLQSKNNLVTSKNEHLLRENESLLRRLNQLSIQDRSKEKEEKLHISQKRIMEMESKNELLRIDLESMRTRILSEMLEKTQMEESLKQKEQRVFELQEQIRSYMTELKKKEVEIINADRNLIGLKQKNDSSNEIIRRISTELEQKKKVEATHGLKITELEAQSKLDHQRFSTLTQDYKIREKEISSLKARLEASQNTVTDLKNKLYVESKQKPIVNNAAMEKLTQEFNSLNVKYKQMEKEIEDFRTIPANQNNRRRREFVQSRDFVERLQYEQRQRINQKSLNERSMSPIRQNDNSVWQKRQYMDKINEIGTLQNTLLQCNIGRNKIMTEMDRIDNTKVKTNEIILRRRRLQEDLKRNELLTDQTKRKLKDLNVI